ncbi:hypothetical protein BD410DRAFT_824158 [Rickenella mellea]|uniref:LIM zinc-binding domain-containing protein n=1 Tax=Rickenella mellea TaxID=50990 RepID=A0A4Y7QNE7_9AGAM|nr:hypothetical protein BD410DRAFT_824158 [Rickenella mellea]
MGFCRRCGDIVAGPRCKCGGTAVAPSVPFNQTTTGGQTSPDRWSRTYVTANKSPTRSTPQSVASHETGATNSSNPSIPVRRFPRPISSQVTHTPLGSKISSHIQAASTHRPSSPLKNNTLATVPPSPPASDILPSPHTSTLTKAYGSVLQPKETLTTFTCFLCSTAFPPDATIYPDPANPSTTTRFLCKPCFTENGGSKGNCQSCCRAVLILASEGGFVENSGKLWHKRCFRCDGCFKDVSRQPMVDLLGRPSCEDCFDSCLKRPLRDSLRRSVNTPDKGERQSLPGGMKGTSREGSPAIEELQQRLGIKSRESSPAMKETTYSQSRSREGSPVCDLSKRVSRARRDSSSPSPSPRRNIVNASPLHAGRSSSYGHLSSSSSNTGTAVSHDAVEEMTKRLWQFSTSSSSCLSSSASITQSESSYTNSISSSTPDLISDFSDTTTQSSPPSTPRSFSPPTQRLHCHDQETPTKTPTRRSHSVAHLTIPESPNTPCSKCSKPLFRKAEGGRFVTVPEDSPKPLAAKAYHVECFRCAVCDNTFEDTKGTGQAAFIRCSNGYCHVGCATPERIVVKSIPKISTNISRSPKEHDRPPMTAPPSMTTFPRFGSSVACPGCRNTVSPMEKGVVPGPQGSRWHVNCLVCGGRGAKSRGRRDNTEPGCGKRLDSGAKTDREGGVWCRDCMILLPNGLPTGQVSPTRPLTPTHTGLRYSRFPGGSALRDGERNVAPQFTGTTTIARQITGLSMQMTGGGLSPTRQLMSRTPSPTKQMRMFPRPKSVMGVRGKSVDEGRGMFLVRQMTGRS